MANVALSLLLIKPKLFCFLFKLSPFAFALQPTRKRVSFINIDTLCVGRRGVAKALKSRNHEMQKPSCVETRHIILRILMALGQIL